MIRIAYILTLALALLSGCNKKDDSDWSVFKIDKGGHSSSSALEWTRKANISFSVSFDSTAIYESVDPINQYDVNKLFGVSDGGLHVRNSARFGWRWLDGKLELLAFTHLNGQFHFEKICDAEIGKEYQCSIELGDSYRFSCYSGGECKSLEMERWEPAKGSRYYLWPYFGGDEVAPHDIYIKIKY